MPERYTTTAFRFTDYEVRSTGDGRTLSGIAVPFDAPTNIGPNEREVFRRGAFSKTVSEGQPNRVKLYMQHGDERGTAPIGAATQLRETNGGLLADMRVARTQRGDEALSLVEDGILDSFSVGFVPIRSNRAADGTIERREVKLLEVSLVAHPAYEDAKVLAIREAVEDEPTTMTLAQARLIATQLRQSAPRIGETR